MKKRSLGERVRYWIDCMMSKGTVAMSVLLFTITAAIVLVVGVIASLIADNGGFIYEVWYSLLCVLDVGNIGGAPTDNLVYLILMLLVTLCGLFITSGLIGIIASGIQEKLDDLRKGTSVVQEDNHTIIIGFDNNVFAILQELIEANSNKKNACVVVLGKEPKDKMEDEIFSHIRDAKTTKIICRSGNLHEAYALERCSVETAKSVIVNVCDDAETVKILLSLATYVRNKKLLNPNLKFVASVQDGQFVESANIAGEGRAAIIYAKDAIARIISNTCRQHGLSRVLTEFFNFDGNELYFEKVPALAGKTFKEATMSFSNAVALGLNTKSGVKLNPPMDTVIAKDDEIVLFELDDGSFKYHAAKKVDETKICDSESTRATANDHLIVLGSNEKLPIILAEYSKYVKDGTKVVVFDDDFDCEKIGTYENLEVSVCEKPITRDLLCEFMTRETNNVLLLNDDSCDCETSDSQTLLRLILLRDIADKNGIKLSITTEMRSVDNQRLASQARVDDFVIGSNFASLIMAQISENDSIVPLIDDLLDESGSELYMKPASNYVPIGVPVDSYILTESAARKGEVYLGYRHSGDKKTDVVVNPPKDETIVFGERDQIVVIAED